MQYEAIVFAKDPASGNEERIFNTAITYVCLDDEGSKRVI